MSVILKERRDQRLYGPARGICAAAKGFAAPVRIVMRTVTQYGGANCECKA